MPKLALQKWLNSWVSFPDLIESKWKLLIQYQDETKAFQEISLLILYHYLWVNPLTILPYTVLFLLRAICTGCRWDWTEMYVVTMMATVKYSVCYSSHYSLSSWDKWTGKCLDQFHKVKSMNWLQENMCFWLGQSCREHIVREGLSGTGRQNFLLNRGKWLGLTKMPIFKGYETMACKLMRGEWGEMSEARILIILVYDHDNEEAEKKNKD